MAALVQFSGMGSTRSQVGEYLRSWHLLLMVTRAALAATRVFFCPDSDRKLEETLFPAVSCRGRRHG